MHSAQTRMHVYERNDNSLRGFRAAASLHCHTYYSKEILNFLPRYAAKVPIVSHFFKNEMNRYLTKNGKPIDFARAYWTPPVSPRQVLEIETMQIEKELGLPAFVSITDHDDIEAGLRLQVLDQARRIPISLEWTMPYGRGYFHIGVHNLPHESAREITSELAKCTAQAEGALKLADLFALLNESPGTLIVLNHPLWDIEYLGPEAHADNLGVFLAELGHRIHALEINGFRSWCENRSILRIADDLGFPVVTGGDRHGCQANTVLNLTRASSFDEFVAEIREDAHSEVLFMPEYRESRVARVLEVFADVLRDYPNHSLGQTRWIDRTFFDLAKDGEPGCVRALSHFWKRGAPAWVEAPLWCLRMLGSRKLQPALRLALANERVSYES